MPVRSPVPAPAPVPVPKPVVSTASAIASAKAAKAASVASPEIPQPGRAASLPPPPPPPPPNGKPVLEEGTTPSVSSVQMDNTPSPATTTPDTAGPAKPGAVVSPSELRNSLITLLTENPKGMTLKVGLACLFDIILYLFFVWLKFKSSGECSQKLKTSDSMSSPTGGGESSW